MTFMLFVYCFLLFIYVVISLGYLLIYAVSLFMLEFMFTSYLVLHRKVFEYKKNWFFLFGWSFGKFLISL